ncbi:hypothetical protein RAS1_30140 [Phycisphaerae bacterium RAS1]|nr:hypothetical protein RAS1_30140 [Phycisphaerae bacterium RAS1]
MKSDAASLRTLTIILLAMVAGIAVLSGVFLYLTPPGALIPKQSEHQLLLAILAGMALMETPVFFGVRSVKLADLQKRTAEAGAESQRPAATRISAAAAARPATSPVNLESEYFSLTLVAAALGEGFALFGAVLYLLTASPLALAAPAAGAAVILLMLPTRDKFERFADNVTRKTLG